MSGKVWYVTLDDFDSTAYIDDFGIGEDKYTDEPVVVVWNDDLQRWEQLREWADGDGLCILDAAICDAVHHRGSPHGPPATDTRISQDVGGS